MTSPLQVINQKELELRRCTREARQRVEGRIQAAHEEARQIVARAEREIRDEARTLYDRGIEQARQEADAALAAARKEAQVLRDRVSARFDNAVEQILTIILPAHSTGQQDVEMSVIGRQAQK